MFLNSWSVVCGFCTVVCGSWNVLCGSWNVVIGFCFVCWFLVRRVRSRPGWFHNRLWWRDSGVTPINPQRLWPRAARRIFNWKTSLIRFVNSMMCANYVSVLTGSAFLKFAFHQCEPLRHWATGTFTFLTRCVNTPRWLAQVDTAHWTWKPKGQWCGKQIAASQQIHAVPTKGRQCRGEGTP